MRENKTENSIQSCNLSENCVTHRLTIKQNTRMKLFIASILILCVAATNAAPIEEINPPTDESVAAIKELTKELENFILGWNSSASLEKNLVYLVINPFDVDDFPEWKSDLSAKENLKNLLAFLDAEGFNKDETLSEYIKKFADSLISIIPLPLFFPQIEIENKTEEVVREFLKKRLHDDSIFQTKLERVIDDWIESLPELEAKKPEDIIGRVIRHILAQIDIPGFGADKTLQENVAAFFVYIFEKVL